MKILNEHYQLISEDMRFEALSQLRELQSNLVGISFLPVIAIMKPTNPLKKDIIQFQDDLDALTINIQEFISKAKNDIDYEPDEGEDEEGNPLPEEEPEEEEVPEEDTEEEEEVDPEDDKKKEKAKDSSEPTV